MKKCNKLDTSFIPMLTWLIRKGLVDISIVTAYDVQNRCPLLYHSPPST
jgi:hypothetical protein